MVDFVSGSSVGSMLLYPLLVLVLQVPSLQSTNVEWYISANGSENVATCGRTSVEPCSSLDVIPSFSNCSGVCCTPGAAGVAVDGTDSTTLHFMGALNFISGLCLMNWSNVRFVGLENNSTIASNRLVVLKNILSLIQCTNVSIENLNFAASVVNEATLFFQASRDIQVAGCSFSLTAKFSIGVKLQHCAGNIALTNTTFFGTAISPLGLDIAHSCIRIAPCSNDRDGEPYDFSTLSFSLTIKSCTFRDLTSQVRSSDDIYKTARAGAVAMRLRFGTNSTANQVLIQDSSFVNNTNTQHNGIVVTYEQLSSNNTVQFMGCSFIENKVRYGGGLSAFFYAGPMDSNLIIEDCEFIDNVADFEGGAVFATFLDSGASNTIIIFNSVFIGNSAINGGGLFLLNNPQWFSNDIPDLFNRPLVTANVTNCTFEDNMVGREEGVVNALRMQLNIEGIRSADYRNSLIAMVKIFHWNNNVQYNEPVLHFTQ